VAATQPMLRALREQLGPWTLSGPTRWVLRLALQDRAWQQQAQARLQNDSARLATTLRANGLTPDGGCSMFQWCRREDAASLHQALAREGVLTRLFEDPPSLRFGLPADSPQFDRLQRTLAQALGRVAGSS